MCVKQMIEIQEELRAALEKNQEQKEQIKKLETTHTSNSDGLPSNINGQLLEMQTHVSSLMYHETGFL